MGRKILDYLKGILDARNPASFGRHACAVIILALLVGTAWVMGHAKAAAVLPDVPTGWLGLITILYGTSKGPDWIAAAKGVAGGPDTKS